MTTLSNTLNILFLCSFYSCKKKKKKKQYLESFHMTAPEPMILLNNPSKNNILSYASQWRIQDFPLERGGRRFPTRVIFGENKRIGSRFGEGSGGAPWICQCTCSSFASFKTAEFDHCYPKH